MFSLMRISRRYLSAETRDIGQIFIKDDVQKILKDITRYDEKRVFKQRQVPSLKSPKFVFMSDRQLDAAKKSAYKEVRARLQMPPVCAADTSEPAVLSKDEDIVGYTNFKIMFIDISPGQANRNRLMSVREKDGTLRFPTHDERTRLNHIFYPGDYKSPDPPKLFEEKFLSSLLKRKAYTYILDRACLQFEPDDPRYVNVTRTVYDHIDEKRDFDMLRSTRHFGPMSLHLAYTKSMDNLLADMLSRKYVEDAVKLVKLYKECHNVSLNFEAADLDILTEYCNNHARNRYSLELALQSIRNELKSGEENGVENANETDEKQD